MSPLAPPPTPRGPHRAELPVRVHGEMGAREGHTLVVGPDWGFVACDPVYPLGARVELEVLVDPSHDAGIHLIGHVERVVRPGQGEAPGIDLIWDDALARDGALVLQHFLAQVLGADDLQVDRDGPPGYEWHHHFGRAGASGHASGGSGDTGGAAQAPGVGPSPLAPVATSASSSVPPDALEAMRRRFAGQHRARRSVVAASCETPTPAPPEPLGAESSPSSEQGPCDPAGAPGVAPAERPPGARPPLRRGGPLTSHPVEPPPSEPGRAALASGPDAPSVDQLALDGGPPGGLAAVLSSEAVPAGAGVSQAASSEGAADLVGAGPSERAEVPGSEEGTRSSGAAQDRAKAARPDGSERRGSVRISAALPISWFFDGQGYGARLRSLSLSGAFVDSDAPAPPIGARVLLRVPLPHGHDKRVVMVTAAVVRYKELHEKYGVKHGFAVRFLSVDELGHKGRLAGFVAHYTKR